MIKKIRTKLLVKSSVSIVLISILSVFSYWNINRTVETGQWVSHTYEVLEKASHLETIVLNMETGSRGFLLTGKEEFLEPYVAGERELKSAVKEIRSLVSDNPVQVKRIHEIDKTIRDWLDEAGRPEVKIRREVFGGSGDILSPETDRSSFTMNDVTSMVEEGTGKRIMDEFRRKLQVFKEEEYSLMAIRQKDSERQNNLTKNIIVLGTLFIVLFTLVWAFWFSGKMSQPINDLKLASDEIGNGKFPGKLNVNTHDELDSLGRAFNEMVEKIKSHESSLLEQREKAEEAKSEAESANEAKTQFLSQMSHELRTPLNSIIGFSQLILNSPNRPLDDLTREDIFQIEKSGNLLLELINQILDLSQIEAGKFPISLEPVNLNEIINDVFETMRPIANENQVSMVHSILEKESPIIFVDHFRCKQVFLNLVSNAIKYNNPGGRVSVYWEKAEGPNVCVFVEDTGKGISKKGRERVFEPFERLEMENSGISGSGVGLAVTKRLVELMKGAVGLKDDVGTGTTFFVEFPLCQEDYLRYSEPVPLPESKKSLVMDSENALNVLYVEDNPANLRYMERFFSDFSQINLISAPSAELGLEIVNSQKLDLILMDIHLPGMKGDEACRRIKSNESFRNIPVVAVSANAMENEIKMMMRAGFSDYITKPVDYYKLTEVVGQHLKIKLV